MKTSLWPVTAVVVLAGTLIAWLGVNSARGTHVALADGSAKRSALAEDISRVRMRLADAERNLADLLVDLKTAPAGAEKRAAAAGPTETGTVRQPSRAAVMEAHPELRPLFRQTLRASMRLYDHYPWFYKAAKLTPEQIQKFEELMIEKEEQKLDLLATAEAQRLGKAVLNAMQQQMDEKLQAAQMELLGTAGYQQWQDFKRAKLQNDLVGGVVAQVALTSDPFTEAQREKLLNVLLTSVRADVDGSTISQYRSYVALAKITDWTRVMAQAQTFLSPTQFSALKGQAANVEAWALVREFCQREGIPAGP